MTEEKKEFRYGIPESRYAEWIEAHQRSGIPQRQILNRLVNLLLDQPPELQAMLLGQIPASDDLIELVLRRMAKPPCHLNRLPNEAKDEPRTDSSQTPTPTVKGKKRFDPKGEVKPHWGRKEPPEPPQ